MALKDGRGLSPKQQAFVEQYLVDLNGTQAAIRAGYSPSTANEQASRLLAKNNIREALTEARARLSERVQRTAADVLADIAKVRANAMQTTIDDETGLPVMLSHKDALKALEMEGKHFGIFEKDNTQKVSPLQDLLAALSGAVVGPVLESAPAGADDEEDEDA